MIKLQEQDTKILAVDVGAGTQDILFFDPAKAPENNIKMVLPSQTQILAKKISKIDGDLLITGEIMGGGPITMAILSHLKKGHRVLMTKGSARTIRDNLDEVRGEGIEIIPDEEAGAHNLPRIEAKDVDLEFIFDVIKRAGEGPPDFVGIAVQDHGYEKGKSDRAFRFEKIRETLERGVSLEDFLFTKPASYYTRMNSVVAGIKKAFDGGVAVIDSKFAAIAGALHGVEERPCLCVDVGNGHTMVALVNNGIDGILEHHTHALTKDRLVDYIKRFAEGKVTNKEVFDDNGHGCYVRNAPGLKSIKRILVTGPHREILRDAGLKAEFASPYGDVMMTGPFGIVDLVRAKYF